MTLPARLNRELRFLRALIRTLRRVGSIKAGSPRLVCDDLADAVARWPGRPAFRFGDAELTYAAADALANRVANWALSEGLGRGDVVALFAQNRIEYVPVWWGLSKIGVVTALINSGLAGEPLAHCVNLSGATRAIVDDEGAGVLEGAAAALAGPLETWTFGEAFGQRRDLGAALSAAASEPPPETGRSGLTASATALLVYTSGTTGLPKAARVTHMRVQLYMRGFAAATDAEPDDRIYVTLPLYHATGGLCAVGAALMNGACAVLRRKFSAHVFWDDVVAERCTMFVYIGELCRYLLNQPPVPAERAHRLRLAFGNGLRPEVWTEMKDRFAIPDILEFYGSTEGNVSLFNFDGKPGAVGRVPAYARSRFNVRLIRYDVEADAPARGPDGFCMPTEAGEVGECVGRIRADARSAFAGYADAKATERKVLHDVFEAGDAWFATGDLMRQDEDGYLYFVDRIGDTFRWKGENVSTSEVEDQLSAIPGVREAIVYGVRAGKAEGRAGMAALVTGPEFDLAAFSSAVDARLQAAARPVFLRLEPEVAVTGTFKHRKADLARDGYDPARVLRPLYARIDGGPYAEIDPALFARIESGAVRL